MSDDLDRLLNPSNPPPTPGLRDRLRAETTRRLRRGRFTRTVARGAALAACFVAGALTAWFARPTQPPEVIVVERPVEKTAPARPEVPRSPHELELAAEQADGGESARLFLAAGRSYGRDFNDWQSALRCYRNALDLGEQPLSDPTTDDWLLTKLKTERRESHANP